MSPSAPDPDGSDTPKAEAAQAAARKQFQRQRASQTIRLLLVFILLGSLFAITGLRQFFVDPIDNNAINLFWFALQVLPLLLLIPGLLRGTRNAFVYCALVSLLYFIHGVMLSSDPTQSRLGILEAGFALVLTGIASLGAKAALALATSSNAEQSE